MFSIFHTHYLADNTIFTEWLQLPFKFLLEISKKKVEKNITCNGMKLTESKKFIIFQVLF